MVNTITKIFKDQDDNVLIIASQTCRAGDFINYIYRFSDGEVFWYPSRIFIEKQIAQQLGIIYK